MLNWEKISIVLVSPKGALNVGGIARLMTNFGLKDLRLVDPRCDLRSVDCKQMAMHGFDLVQNAKIFPSFEEAVADKKVVIALSGRDVTDPRPQSDLYEIQDKVFPTIQPDESIALVFGREEIGLKLEELCHCHWQIQIPTFPDWTSINLTSAVAMTLSWFFQTQRAQGQSPKSIESVVRERPTHAQKAKFFDRLFDFLNRTKFLNPENPMHLRDDVWGIMHRADLDERELRILFGILVAFDQALPKAVSKNCQP